MIRKSLLAVASCTLVTSSALYANYENNTNRSTQMNDNRAHIHSAPQNPNMDHSQDTGNMSMHQTITELQNAIKSSYKNYNINIHVSDGDVTLRGIVNSEEDKKGIEDKVRSVHGVKNINNQLHVTDMKQNRMNDQNQNQNQMKDQNRMNTQNRMSDQNRMDDQNLMDE